jgi:hypothetical protein
MCIEAFMGMSIAALTATGTFSPGFSSSAFLKAGFEFIFPNIDTL